MPDLVTLSEFTMLGADAAPPLRNRWFARLTAGGEWIRTKDRMTGTKAEHPIAPWLRESPGSKFPQFCTDGLHDSLLEEGVSCELVSENPEFPAPYEEIPYAL